MKDSKPFILFIVPASTGDSPSQRFRHEHYLDLLSREGYRYRLLSFYSHEGWKALYTNGNRLRKSLLVFRGLIRRFISLFTLGRYTHIYIHREATPVGPAFFEWLAARVFRKKIIYDFDDSIWLPVTSEYNKGISWLRNFSKVGRNCRRAWKVSVGNEYLASYARRFNKNVVIIPTVVNTETVHNGIQEQRTDHPAVGWTGSFSTLPYLDITLPVLKELQEQIDFEFVVIADKDPQLSLKRYRFIRWSRQSEMADLLQFHIGIMPLHDDEISRGKCGFKAIQYMSLGIPAVVSPVGVNTKIVQDGVNGFVCATNDEWKRRLEELLRDPALRERMGLAAHASIEKNYSVKATGRIFLDLFN